MARVCWDPNCRPRSCRTRTGCRITANTIPVPFIPTHIHIYIYTLFYRTFLSWQEFLRASFFFTPSIVQSRIFPFSPPRRTTIGREWSLYFSFVSFGLPFFLQQSPFPPPLSLDRTVSPNGNNRLTARSPFELHHCQQNRLFFLPRSFLLLPREEYLFTL